MSEIIYDEYFNLEPTSYNKIPPENFISSFFFYFVKMAEYYFICANPSSYTSDLTLTSFIKDSYTIPLANIIDLTTYQNYNYNDSNKYYIFDLASLYPDGNDSSLKNNTIVNSLQTSNLNLIYYCDNTNINFTLSSLNCNNEKKIISISFDSNNNLNLNTLRCNTCNIINLDVSKLTNLTSLYCYQNQIEILNVTNLTNLTTLNCYQNQIEILNVTNLINLTTLNCHQNQIINLDVTNLINLTTLNCNNNQIINLDISKLTKLINLSCYNNLITYIDLSNKVNLSSCKSYCCNLKSIKCPDGNVYGENGTKSFSDLIDYIELNYTISGTYKILIGFNNFYIDQLDQKYNNIKYVQFFPQINELNNTIGYSIPIDNYGQLTEVDDAGYYKPEYINISNVDYISYIAINCIDTVNNEVLFDSFNNYIPNKILLYNIKNSIQALNFANALPLVKNMKLPITLYTNYKDTTGIFSDTTKFNLIYYTTTPYILVDNILTTSLISNINPNPYKIGNTINRTEYLNITISNNKIYILNIPNIISTNTIEECINKNLENQNLILYCSPDNTSILTQTSLSLPNSKIQYLTFDNPSISLNNCYANINELNLSNNNLDNTNSLIYPNLQNQIKILNLSNNSNIIENINSLLPTTKNVLEELNISKNI